MLISKRRIIHALSYEIILLVIIAVALSFIFHMPLEVTGVLGIAMAVTSVIWFDACNHPNGRICNANEYLASHRARLQFNHVYFGLYLYFPVVL